MRPSLSAPAARALAVSGVLLVGAALALAPAGPAPLGYDPEAWLTWGRELVHGPLDVTAGPAIKPAPIMVDAVLVGAVGDGAARAAWAALAAAGLLAALALTWRVVRGSGAPAGVAVIAVLLVAGVPTLIAGGLTGAGEPLALAGVLAAVLRLRAGRPVQAIALLAAVATLRPEVLPGAALIVVALAHGAHGARRRASTLLAGATLLTAVIGAWMALQLAGGGSLAGGVDAANGVGEQPLHSLRSMPWLHALAAAARLLGLPALLAIAVRVATAPRPPAASPSISPRGPLADWRAPGIVGTLWALAVIVMSEFGFSGEERYLAPAAALLVIAALGWAADGRDWRVPAALPTVAAVAGAIALWVGATAWHDARALAASQRELSGLLRQPAVARSAATCARIAVPRALRPATAWRLRIPIHAVQSPEPAGADCLLVRGDAEPIGSAADRRRAQPTFVARDGRWSWWTIHRHPR